MGVYEKEKMDPIDEAIKIAHRTLQEAAQDVAQRDFMTKTRAWDGKILKNLNPSLRILREAISQLLSLRNLKLQEQK